VILHAKSINIQDAIINEWRY